MTDVDHRHVLTRGLGVAGALAGTAAVLASGAPGSIAEAEGTDPGGASDASHATNGVAASGTYESCTAMFGLTAKNSASWVIVDVDDDGPLSPPATLGPELQAILTVHASSGPEVDCELDAPAWTDEAGWLEYVRVQRGDANLDDITGRYPYPGGPGYAIPNVGGTYGPPGQPLPDTVTVSGSTLTFAADTTRFTVVAGSPQDLTNIGPTEGAAAQRAEVEALDPSFTTTEAACATTPATATPEEITAAVDALGTVWGVDVDALYPPSSPSVDDRCTAFTQAKNAYFFDVTRSTTVGSTATVTVAAPAPPTTSTTAPTTTTTTATTTTSSASTSTTLRTPSGATGAPAAAVVVAPTFTG